MAGASSSASMTPTTCSRSTPERRSRHGSRKWPGRGSRLCSSSATSSFTGKGWSTSSTSSASPAPGCSPGNGSSLAAVTPRRHSTHSRRSCGRLQPEADVFPRTITNCDPEIPAARGTDHIRPFGAQRVIKLTEHDDAAAGHAVATLWSSYGWQGAPFAVQQLLVQAIETGYCLALGDVRDGNFDAEIKMWRTQLAD